MRELLPTAARNRKIFPASHRGGKCLHNWGGMKEGVGRKNPVIWGTAGMCAGPAQKTVHPATSYSAFSFLFLMGSTAWVKSIRSGAFVFALPHSKSSYLQAAEGLLGTLYNPTLQHYRSCWTLLFPSPPSCQQGLSRWRLTQGQPDM